MRRLAALLLAHVVASYSVMLLDLLRLANWEGYELRGPCLMAWVSSPLTLPYFLCALAWHAAAGNTESLVRAAVEWPAYLLAAVFVYRTVMRRWKRGQPVRDGAAL